MARRHAPGGATRGDGTIPPLRHQRTLLTAATASTALACTGFSAARAGAWWPLSAVLGVAAALWLARCAVRSHAGGVWLGITALAGAYVVALQGNIDAVDTWAAVYAAALFAIAELAHSATGTPDLGGADAATRGRYSRTVALGILAGFGTADLLVAAASPGGSGGAGIAALGVACAAAAFGVLALAARRLSSL